MPRNGANPKEIGRRERVRTTLYVPKVVVKFHDDFKLPYEDGVERYFDKKFDKRFDEEAVAVWNNLVATFGGITLQRLITSVTPKQIQKIVAEAKHWNPDYKEPNFLSFFVVTCPPGKARKDPQALVEALSSWPPVQLAYVQSPLAKPPGVTRSASEVVTQPYHGPAGINAEYAWGVAGGDGAGLQFADIEQGWQVDHEDLPPGQLPPTGIITKLSSPRPEYYVGHGTAVLGIVLAVPGNADPTFQHRQPGCKDCVGIAPNVAAAYIASEVDIDPNDDWNHDRVNAIFTATERLGPGDVLLLEGQIETSTGYLPVEYEYAVFLAIEAATQKVVVVEPAGNGGANGDGNLDNLVLWGDSGAIVVASAYSTANPDRPCPFRYCRSAGTNFGTRINCFAWDDRVYTTGDGATGASTTDYTDFSGTSAASAIVAGAALALQGIAQANHAGDPDPFWNYRFRPDTVRRLLSDPTRSDPNKPETGNTLSGISNTLAYDPLNPSRWNAENIGVMPNLKAIIERRGLAPDVYIRDSVGDTGATPHMGPISTSPDVILRPAPVANPQAEYGEVNVVNRDNLLLSVNAVLGQPHYIYIRVRNRGGTDAENVSTKVYWSPAATLLTPTLWNPAGNTTIPLVPKGDILTVSPAIPWIPNQPGHFCFVALIGSAADPEPDPSTIADWVSFENLVRNNNNVTWRNFNVISNEPDPQGGLQFVEERFLITGPHDQDRDMRLEVVAKFPQQARLMLRVRIEDRKFIEGLGQVEPDDDYEFVQVSLKPSGSSQTKNILFSRNSKSVAFLRVHIPKEFRDRPYEVYARQLYEEREVGRITWRLVPSRRMEEHV